MADELKNEDIVSEGAPKHEWKYCKRFPIHNRIAEILRLAIKASEQQLAADRKKLQRLQYGS